LFSKTDHGSVAVIGFETVRKQCPSITLVRFDPALSCVKVALTPAIALFKLKHDVDPSRVQEWRRLAQDMVGKVPGRQLELPTAFTLLVF